MSEPPEYEREWEGFEDHLAQALEETTPPVEKPPPDRTYEQSMILGGLDDA